MLIFFSTLIDYSIGLALKRETKEKNRKLFLWASVGVNLGVLGLFKYFNFFIESFSEGFELLGYQLNSWTLNIILPVGISFYTFQTLSYTIDVYRKTIEPTTDFISFAAFVSFFPQLVAGPIERAKNLLPQFCTRRKFDYNEAKEGLKQILWGLFKKMVIADNCAVYVNTVFENPNGYNGSVLLVGAILFAFQIYADFSGYSDMAIGTARLFGFRLMQNFAFPYFSRDIAEFWRRWHISLSTWFRDYVYIPLGGSRGTLIFQIRNIFAIFLLSGLWHGANWTFVIWGGLNAFFFLPLLLMKKNRKNLDVAGKDSSAPSIREVFSILFTFLITVFAWIFFRAENFSHALQYLINIFDLSLFSIPELGTSMSTKLLIMLILIMLLVEWVSRKKSFGLSGENISRHRIIRWLFYFFLIVSIGLFMEAEETPFIYFQF